MKYQSVLFRFFPLLVFAIPLVLYIKTLAPSYIPIDSAEFALCAKFWGICHPPGFPLYTLIGHFFVNYFPFGSVIYKANLLSAIFGSLTVLALYLTFITVKVKKPLAFVLSVLFAFSNIFWEFSLSADIFTFSTFLVILSFLALFNKQFWLAFLFLGFSTSHFYLSLVLFPLFVVYGIRVSDKSEYQSSSQSDYQKIRKILVWGIMFGLGLLPQLIMYMRMQQDPFINWGHAEGIGGFINFVRRKEFGSIFLLANPALTFSPVKVFKHLYLYFANLFFSFGLILPIVAFFGSFWGKFWQNKKFLLVFVSFLILFSVQLFLLSTIDPTGVDNPFQINKFYLTSFLLAVLWIGMVVNFLNEKFFQDNNLGILFIGLLAFIYLLANLKTHDYSKNYFSQNLVDDALSQLPQNSVAITVGHVFYFGSLYEQSVNNKYKSLDVLYFPNEKNKDQQYYKAHLFKNPQDQTFIKKVSSDKSLGNAESYILEVISRNLDRDIYILQGSFEEGFFGYMKPYIKPYGLWWKVASGSEVVDPSLSVKQFENMKNSNLKFGDLILKQENLDLLTYAVAYHSTGIELASAGKYSEAKEMLGRAINVRPDGKNRVNIDGEIQLIEKTAQLESERISFTQTLNKDKLAQLGNNYFTLSNFKACEEIYLNLISLEESAQFLSNLAQCQAFIGKTAEAKLNYQKALELNPKIDSAREGLEKLKND